MKMPAAPNQEIKLCDHCGEKPRKIVIQMEGSWEVVCEECSAKYLKPPPEQYIDREIG